MKMRLLTTLIITFWSFSVNAQLDFNPAELGRQAVESSLGKSQDTLYNQAMENIKNSYTKEKVFTKDPEWYTPDNGLYGGTGMRSDYRGSSEEKIYNLSEKSDTIDSSINVLDKRQTFVEKLVFLIRFSYDLETLENFGNKIRHFYHLYFLMQGFECITYISRKAFKNDFIRILSLIGRFLIHQ
jgi:hypothetical protein